MTEQIGKQLGNYRLLRCLGRGGFAEVYLGEHTYLHKPAALKLLHLRLSEQDTDQFLGEAQTLARLDHPHIVRVLDFAVQDGFPYLVMDYAVGGTLRSRHPAGTRVPLEQILAYVSQVASALQYAHDQHLIHRDIKPENLLLDAHEQVLLADFGLALHTATRSASTQAMGAVMTGTAAYLAPEQVQGHPCAASDQYALAIVVYEWLCGQRPFKGTPIEVAMQHVSAAPPPFHEQLSDLSPQVEEVVMRALAKAPEQRFLSVQDFAIALHQAALATGNVYITLPAMPVPSPTIVPQGEREYAAPGELPAEACWKVPTSFTSLVGREQEVAAICTMLSRPEVRLLTLLGVGGIGKTRLAIQIATQMRDRFADGACFVNLAPISDPSLVIFSIAHELGLQEAGVQPLVETVKAWLREKQFLLLLDNFEQIVTAAPLLKDLLVACPRLVILVTSREVLHLSAEYLFPVPSLTLPDLARLPEQEDLGQYAAVSLFLQRAQAIQPNFRLTPANASASAEICVRLDGLPLAIELAAARSKLLPPQALLKRLSNRFEVLTGGAQNLPGRQQTLRNTMSWSYQLLEAAEQCLFRRLAVFMGGCTLVAVEAVCGERNEGAGWAMDGVASLLDKSLLRQVEQTDGEPRLLMLQTLREFGLECLASEGETETTRQAHANYYLAFAEEAEAMLSGPEQVRWLERLEQEHENLRTALQWLLEQAEGVQARGDEAEMALRLAGALWRFWSVRGHLSEGRHWLERVLAGGRLQAGHSAGTQVAASLRAKALTGAVSLALAQDDYDQTEVLSRESLELYRELGEKAGMAFSLQQLADIAYKKNNYAQAGSLLEEALLLFKEVGDEEGMAAALDDLAYGATDQGEYTRARELAEQALAISRKVNDKRSIIYALLRLGRVLFFSQVDLARSRQLAEEALTNSKQVGYKWGRASSLGLLGQLALLEDEDTTARTMLEEALVIRKELGDRFGIAWALYSLGSVHTFQGDYMTARRLYEESLAIVRKIEEKELTASCLERLGEVVAAQGEPAWAARLWGEAEALRQAVGAPMALVNRATYERALALARAKLGEQAFRAAWAEGRMMTLEQAVAAQEQARTSIALLAQSAAAPPLHAPTSPFGLTAREVEVLRLLTQGLSDAQIAAHLNIRVRTVNHYTSSLYSKLGVSSRAAAIHYAIEHHLL